LSDTDNFIMADACAGTYDAFWKALDGFQYWHPIYYPIYELPNSFEQKLPQILKSEVYTDNWGLPPFRSKWGLIAGSIPKGDHVLLFQEMVNALNPQCEIGGVVYLSSGRVASWLMTFCFDLFQFVRENLQNVDEIYQLRLIELGRLGAGGRNQDVWWFRATDASKDIFAPTYPHSNWKCLKSMADVSRERYTSAEDFVIWDTATFLQQAAQEESLSRAPADVCGVH